MGRWAHVVMLSSSHQLDLITSSPHHLTQLLVRLRLAAVLTPHATTESISSSTRNSCKHQSAARTQPVMF